jgi:hypothetical protein
LRGRETTPFSAMYAFLFGDFRFIECPLLVWPLT